MIERIPITSREQWLALRKNDVTASAAAALLDVHPWLTGYSLYLEKTGKLPESDEMTAPMERGVELEEIAVRRIRKKYPNWIVETPNTYYRDTDARLGATPDAVATDPARSGFGAVQIKSVEPSIFRKRWRDEDGAIEPPLWIVIQALIEAELTGATWAACAALVIGHGIDLHLVEVPLHRGIIERVRAEVDAFWRMVNEGREPAPDYGRDAALIARLYATAVDGEPIDLTARNDLPELCAEDARLRAEINERDERRKAIRAELLHAVGTASAARIAGGLLTAKQINRKAYQVGPKSYREIRFREDAV